MLSFFRFIFRNKLYSLINFVGLTVSLAFVVMIFGYTVEQRRISRSIPECDRAYVAMKEGQTLMCYGAHDRIAALPEVEAVTSFKMIESGGVVKYNSKSHLAEVQEADMQFIDFMGVEVLSGNLEDFARNDAVLVAESFARRIFSDEEPLGKGIELNGRDFTVVGVYKDYGSGLLKHSDIIVKMDSMPTTRILKERYGFSIFMSLVTIARVAPGTNPDAFRANVLRQFEDISDFHDDLSMVPAGELYFHQGNYVLNNGNINLLRSLQQAGIVLLILALLNYINLNTALVGKRATEMATRRLLGSSRRDILLKYLAESGAFTFVCFAAALLLAVLFIPVLNSLIASDASTELHISDLFKLGNIVSYVLVGALVSVVAGLVPAMIASRVSPIATIKGETRRRNRGILARVFIVLQNVISISLIALSVTMEVQYRHMVNRPVGVDMENLFYLDPDPYDGYSANVLSDRLKGLPCVAEVGRISGSLPTMMSQSQTYNPEENTSPVTISVTFCDSTALKMMGYKVLERFGEDVNNGMYVTRQTFNLLEQDPFTEEGRAFVGGGVIKNTVVTALIDDYLVSDITSAEALGSVIILDKEEYHWGFLIRTTGDHKAAREAIAGVLNDYNMEVAGIELEPYFCDYVMDLVADGAEDARHSMKLMEIFMIISVLLSLSGLVAISLHVISSSTKSIALHKIYGADTAQETLRNLRLYFISTLIANMIAIPISVLLCRHYLEGFSYRIDLSPWIFVATAVISLLLTFISVILQVRHAAGINPAKALKAE